MFRNCNDTCTVCIRSRSNDVAVEKVSLSVCAMLVELQIACVSRSGLRPPPVRLDSPSAEMPPWFCRTEALWIAVGLRRPFVNTAHNYITRLILILTNELPRSTASTCPRRSTSRPLPPTQTHRHQQRPDRRTDGRTDGRPLEILPHDLPHPIALGRSVRPHLGLPPPQPRVPAHRVLLPRHPPLRPPQPPAQPLHPRPLRDAQHQHGVRTQQVVRPPVHGVAHRRQHRAGGRQRVRRRAVPKSVARTYFPVLEICLVMYSAHSIT